MRTIGYIVLMLYPLALFAQSVKRVKGEYIYHPPENVTLEQAKQTALERAQLQALADEFGTLVTQHNATTMHNVNGQSSTDFTSLSSSDVKGEWIETIGKPEYVIAYEQGMLVVKCTISGKAREITTAKSNFVAKVLRNGFDNRAEADNFKSGDDLFLAFQSPTNSYLAVYLVDASDNAFCLLPYRSSATGKVEVKANQRYVFFSEKTASPLCNPNEVDEYTMTCDRSSETNYIYVITSPNPFIKAVDNVMDEGLPRELSFTDFEKWLSKNRTHDKEMQVEVKTITVTK